MVNFGANIYVCIDHAYFKAYHITSGGSMTLGNDFIAHVLQIGQVNLKITCRKILTFMELQHTLKVRRTLMYHLQSNKATKQLWS